MPKMDKVVFALATILGFSMPVYGDDAPPPVGFPTSRVKTFDTPPPFWTFEQEGPPGSGVRQASIGGIVLTIVESKFPGSPIRTDYHLEYWYYNNTWLDTGGQHLIIYLVDAAGKELPNARIDIRLRRGSCTPNHARGPVRLDALLDRNYFDVAAGFRWRWTGIGSAKQGPC